MAPKDGFSRRGKDMESNVKNGDGSAGNNALGVGGVIDAEVSD